MKLNGLADQRKRLYLRFAGGNASRKVGHICPEGCGAFLDYDEIAHFPASYFFSPACFNALLSVPGGTSMPGFPATVTVPGLLGW